MEICEFRSGNHVSGGFGQSVVFHVVSLGLGFFLPRRQNCCVGVIIIIVFQTCRAAAAAASQLGKEAAAAEEAATPMTNGQASPREQAMTLPER